VNAVAKDLGVEPKVVMEMESRMSGADNSFDAPVGVSDDRALAPAEVLEQDNADPSMLLEQADGYAHSVEGLTAGLETLDERSRDILQRRWLTEKKSTLHELAAEYHVSAERIRQIEKSAMNKLKAQLVVA